MITYILVQALNLEIITISKLLSVLNYNHFAEPHMFSRPAGSGAVQNTSVFHVSRLGRGPKYLCFPCIQARAWFKIPLFSMYPGSGAVQNTSVFQVSRLRRGSKTCAPATIGGVTGCGCGGAARSRVRSLTSGHGQPVISAFCTGWTARSGHGRHTQWNVNVRVSMQGRYTQCNVNVRVSMPAE